MDFDAPVEDLDTINERLKMEEDIIRNVIVRKRAELGRPCDDQDCDYGELTDENRERNMKYRKQYMKYL